MSHAPLQAVKHDPDSQQRGVTDARCRELNIRYDRDALDDNATSGEGFNGDADCLFWLQAARDS